MTTTVAPVAAVAVKAPRLPAGHAMFHKLYGHYPTECLIGCYREKGRGEEKVQVHRNSLGRPGDNAGLPFSETYAEKLARKAAKRNGPVRVVTPPEAPTMPVKLGELLTSYLPRDIPAPITPKAPKATAAPTAKLTVLTGARMDAQDSRLTVLEVKLDKLIEILTRKGVSA